MSYWIACFSDFPLNDDDEKIPLFETEADAVNWAIGRGWTPDFCYALECIPAAQAAIVRT